MQLMITRFSGEGGMASEEEDRNTEIDSLVVGRNLIEINWNINWNPNGLHSHTPNH